MSAEVPTFVKARPLTRAALEYASRMHEGQEREADHAPFVLHPLEVASLLDAYGFDDAVTAAAVLHDALEDTDATGDEIAERFGPRVARLVSALTEPDLALPEPARKAALRDQIAGANREAAAIFAADKVSKVRELRIRLSRQPGLGGEPAAETRVDHYWQSLAMLETVLGRHPLVGQLRFELEAMRALPPREASRPDH
jgi:(p)ppGpp synthase/HD superfamily hydrolase